LGCFFMHIAMIGDRIVPAEQVDSVYFDRGTFFGDGVYEVLRSYDGRLFALDEHLERFANSLSAVGITGLDIDTIRGRILQAVDAAGIPNAKIYFHVTRGSEPRSRVADSALKPNFFLTVGEVGDNTEEKTTGIAVSTFPDWRWRRCDIKSLNLLANVLASTDAAKKGCGEAILVDEAGFITEGAGSAFFAIFGDTLRTAPLTANILSSITRKFVLEAARNIGLEVVEESLKPTEAVEADELLIAATTRDIVPAVKFDDRVIADGKPGEKVKSIARQFRSYTG